jgi:hypothetical protein
MKGETPLQEGTAILAWDTLVTLPPRRAIKFGMMGGREVEWNPDHSREGLSPPTEVLDLRPTGLEPEILLREHWLGIF